MISVNDQASCNDRTKTKIFPTNSIVTQTEKEYNGIELKNKIMWEKILCLNYVF
jgi:hypothetical protein